MKTKFRDRITFYLNGRLEEVGAEHARMMLADYLREAKRLTGTKIVCAEGDCGACSVLRLQPQFSKSKRQGRFLAINSCITTVAQMDGSSLVTVDALAMPSDEAHASNGAKLSPVQKSMMESHGSQCGFCTPGFVVALTGLVEKKLCQGITKGTCTAKEAMNATTGNLCRCTGYQPIIDSATRLDLGECESLNKRFLSKNQQKTLAASRTKPICFKDDRFSFYAPTKLADAAKYLSKNKTARLIGAGTDLGVVHNKGKLKLTHLVSLHLIPELYQIQKSAKTVKVGARVSLSELRVFVQKLVPEFSTFLDLFASPQIKNSATLIGNIGNASPIADTPPFLLTTNTVLHIIGPKGKRKLPFEKFYLGYRKTALKPGELISSIEFEIPRKNSTLKLYKVSQRKDLDISAINAAIHVEWEKSGRPKIDTIKIAFGGVAATPVRVPKTETFLKGKTITGGVHDETLKRAVELIQTEITPLDDLRGSGRFRRVLAQNLFLKFFREELKS
ncbi:MAG: FAD binding domain-containing protein [Bdellovibrionales bacterium]|nr:FAD binding domain-containing protein [Bdellovibrionales bacterium]